MAGVIGVVVLATAVAGRAGIGWLSAVEASSDEISEPSTAVVVSVAPNAGTAPAGAAGRQGVRVERGSIAAVVNLAGRVAALEEVPVSFTASGRVETVGVTPGQEVQRGDLLLEADARELQKELSSARAKSETASLRLAQAQAQAQAGRQEAARRAFADRTRQEAAVAEAEAAQRRALAERDQMSAGPDATELRRAEQDLAAAQLALQRAEADRARLLRGADPADLRKADQDAAAAQVALQRVEADQARVLRGADPADLRKAEQDLAAAQVALQRAEADRARLLRGPEPAAVASATRDLAVAESKLERAQVDLRRLSRAPEPTASRAAPTARPSEAQARTTAGSTNSAYGAPVGISSSQAQELADRAARAAAASQAAAPLPGAEAPGRTSGPAAEEIEAARRALELAQLEVEVARERLESLQRGPDDLAVATASAAVESARAGVQQAEARLLQLREGAPAEQAAVVNAAVDNARLTLEQANDRVRELQAGAPTDQVAVVTAATEAARLAVQHAEARVAELKRQPRTDEVREADARVAAAQAALARARAGADSSQPALDPQVFDLMLLERAVEHERAQVEAIEKQLAATRLHAPISGTVVAVRARTGDPIEPGRPAVILTQSGQPIIRVDLPEREAARVAVGQTASVQLDGAADGPLSASVVELIDAVNGTGRVAVIEVAWPATPPAFGANAQVAITVEEKHDVLLIPEGALRSTGARRYVESMEGGSRRTVNVEVGITSGGNVEVLSGLREGQSVLVRR
jgi:RND family efflux transporter MFP subunit